MMRSETAKARRAKEGPKGRTLGKVEDLKKANKVLGASLETAKKGEALKRQIRAIKAELNREASQYLIIIEDPKEKADKRKIIIFYEPKKGRRETAIKYLRYSQMVANKWGESQANQEAMGNFTETMIINHLTRAETKTIVSRAKRGEPKKKAQRKPTKAEEGRKRDLVEEYANGKITFDELARAIEIEERAKGLKKSKRAKWRDLEKRTEERLKEALEKAREIKANKVY